MEPRVNVGGRIARVFGAVLGIPLVAAVVVFALLRLNDPDRKNSPDPEPIPIPTPLGDGTRVTRDVVFGRAGGETLRLDVYRGEDRGSPRPALLLIHGGGWVEGDKATEAPVAGLLVARGFVVFAINYRLVRDESSRYPAAILDVRRAARWARAHAADFGADPARLAAVGLSAGGHLAAILGTTDEPDPDDPNSGRFPARVDCVVDTAGPTDFTDEANPPVGPKIAEVIPIFFGRGRAEIPDAYRAASPALRVDAKAAPTLIVHGTADDIVPIGQSQRFDQALSAAGVEHKFVVIEGEGHGFAQLASQQRWLDEMGDWLVGHLKP